MEKADREMGREKAKMIRVIYRTGEEDLVSAKFLDILLYLKQVQMFQRSNGWTVVDVDPLRSADTDQHPETERRLHRQTALPTTLKKNIFASTTMTIN